MNIYLISQDINDSIGAYCMAVVAALSEDDARSIHPNEDVTYIKDCHWMGIRPANHKSSPGCEYEYRCDDWVEACDTGCVHVERIGETSRSKGVILAS